MSYVDKMRERRKTPHTSWHKVRTTIATNRFDLFVACEGEEDEEFYSSYLYRRKKDLKICPLVCDGKGALLALHDKVSKRYAGLRNVYFFADSDHDVLIGEELPGENFFFTDGYSFESYGLSKDVVVKLVERNFSLHPTDPILNSVGDIVSDAIKMFSRRARTIMTYVLHLRRMDVTVNVDKLHFFKFFDINGDVVQSKKCSLMSISEISDLEEVVTFSEILATARDIRELKDERIIRGKMVAQFLIRLLKCFAKTLQSREKLNGKKCAVRIELGGANYAQQIANVAPETERLSQFLDQIITGLRIDPPSVLISHRSGSQAAFT